MTYFGEGGSSSMPTDLFMHEWLGVMTDDVKTLCCHGVPIATKYSLRIMVCGQGSTMRAYADASKIE